MKDGLTLVENITNLSIAVATKLNGMDRALKRLTVLTTVNVICTILMLGLFIWSIYDGN